MARSDLEIGDVGELKSGGPEMTVSEVEGDTVTCRFWDGKAMNGGVFMIQMLKLVRKE